MTDNVEKKDDEVNFKDLELAIKKPAMSKAGVMTITGNFDELARQITAVVNRYKGTVLTEDNVNYVSALKRQFVSLRTGIEAKRKDWKKMYLSTAEDMLDAMCADLQKIVAEGEHALGVQLDAYDQRRKDEITRALTDYISTVVESKGLRPEFAGQIQLKKQYYNKTQSEADSCDDIDRQADDLSRRQSDYDAGVALIRAECEGTTLVADNYIGQLQFRSASELVLQIKDDRRKAEELYQRRREAEEQLPKATVGAPVDESLFTTPKPVAPEPKAAVGAPNDDRRERTLWIRYRKSQAALIQDFLVSNGIEFKFI